MSYHYPGTYVATPEIRPPPPIETLRAEKNDWREGLEQICISLANSTPLGQDYNGIQIRLLLQEFQSNRTLAAHHSNVLAADTSHKLHRNLCMPWSEYCIFGSHSSATSIWIAFHRFMSIAQHGYTIHIHINPSCDRGTYDSHDQCQRTSSYVV